jgi:hypothetical protein
MSVAAVSNLSSPPTAVSPYRQEHQDGWALENALRSGNLTAAQSAYNALAAFGPNNSGPFKAPELTQQFQALGQAISSGDLASAQQAALTLRQTYIKFQQQPTPAPVGPTTNGSADTSAAASGINVQA